MSLPPRLVTRWLWLAGLSWCLFTPLGRAQTDDEKAVRATAERAMQALQNQNREQWRELLAEGLPTGKLKFLESPKEQEPVITSFTIRSVTVKGNQARVRIFCEQANRRTGQPLRGYGFNHLSMGLTFSRGRWGTLWTWPVEMEFAHALFAAPEEGERRQLLAQEPELDAGEAVIRMAYRFYSAGHYEQAEEALNLGAWLAREKNDAGLAARVTLNRGIALAQRGDFAPALAFILASLRDCEARRDSEGIPRALLEIGAIYRKQGNVPLALDYFHRTLTALQGLDETRNLVTLRLVHDALGEIQAALGNYDESRRFYETGFQLAASYQRGPFLSWSEKILLARLDALAGRDHKALLNLIVARDEMVALLETNHQGSIPNVNVPEYLAQVNLHIAALCRRQRAFDKALASAQDAVAPALQTKNQDLIGQVYTLLGQIQEDLKQPEAAAQSYRQAVAAIEEQRGRIVGREENYANYFARRVTPYNALVSLLLRRNLTPQNLEAAFALAEQGKARVLADALRGARPDASQLMNEREKAQEQALRATLTDANRRHFAAETALFKDEKQVAKTSTQVETARRAYEDWQTQLRAAYPQLALVNGPSRAPLTPDEAAALFLKANHALLEYVVADDETYLFVLTQAAGRPLLRVYALGLKPQDVKREVTTFREAIMPDAGGEPKIGYKPAAHSLYQRLMQPAQAQLAGKTNLLIVPDGELWELPFQALVGADGRRHLIETAAISYAPSLAALSEMTTLRQTRQQTAKRSLLAFGNPLLSNATLAQSTTRADDYGPLPDATTEVRQLGRMFGAESKVLTGAEATENAWKKEAGAYRFLHLATHGQANDRNPLYSRLMLARQSGDTAEDDGLLEAWEVMNVRLNADLAVLSACDTGRGQISRGESVMGLSWAFFVGGAPTTIVSHWRVNSPNTAKLMTEFYRRLQTPARNADISPAEAFQFAAKKMLTGTADHPYYWAGFSVIGAAH